MRHRGGGELAIRLAIQYDGQDAARHQLDMRLFGQSMVGLDKAIHETFFVAAEGRLPKQRERLPLSVQVAPPHAACVDVRAVIEATAGVLPFAYELFVNVGSDYIFNVISYLLKSLGGRQKEADPHFERLMELYRESQSQLLHDRQLEREAHYASDDRWRETLLEVMDRLTPAAKQIVAPVGPSCNVVKFENPKQGQPATEVDVPMADAVRSSGQLEVGDMERMRVKLDGVIKHNRSVKVEIAGDPGRYVNAEVRDPSFEQSPNIYTDALVSGDFIEVNVKPTRRRTGELVRLYIMDASALADAA